jgi:tetratricopeptide (TPR) repeat protein
MGLWPWRKEKSQDRWTFMMAEIAHFRPLLAGYPPNCPDLQEVGRRWERAVHAANEHVGATGNSPEASWAFAELLRMGHNMDAHKTSPFAREILAQAPPGWRAENLADVALPMLLGLVDEMPDDYRPLLSAAELTLAAFEGGADRTEEFYLRAAKLAPPAFRSDIFQGLGFTYLKQGKTAEAIESFERCVEAGNSSPRIQEILARLRAGGPWKNLFRKD